MATAHFRLCAPVVWYRKRYPTLPREVRASRMERPASVAELLDRFEESALVRVGLR